MLGGDGVYHDINSFGWSKQTSRKKYIYLYIYRISYCLITNKEFWQRSRSCRNKRIFVMASDSWCHENGSFIVHCLYIPQNIGSWGNRFQETHSIFGWFFKKLMENHHYFSLFLMIFLSVIFGSKQEFRIFDLARVLRSHRLFWDTVQKWYTAFSSQYSGQILTKV